MIRLLGLTIVLLLCGCKSEAWKAEEKQKQQKWAIDNAIENTAKIDYIYDKRTGLCFAYIWGGGANGGPALAVVPLETVKDHLINPPEHLEN